MCSTQALRPTTYFGTCNPSLRLHRQRCGHLPRATALGDLLRDPMQACCAGLDSLRITLLSPVAA